MVERWMRLAKKSSRQKRSQHFRILNSRLPLPFPWGHGGVIGEISLLDLGPRTATATTLTPSLLLKVNSVGFEALLEADPAVRKALEAEAARRLERIDADGGS